MSNDEKQNPKPLRRRKLRATSQEPEQSKALEKGSSVPDETALQTMAERREVGRVERKYAAPLTYSQYQAAWVAFQEKSSVNHVARKAGIKRAIAAKLIEEGWPEVDFQPLAERLAAIRRKLREEEDHDLTVAMRQNAQICRGVKARFIRSLGAGFEKLSFGSFENLTPTSALRLAKFLEQIARTEAFVMGDDMPGSYKNQHTGDDASDATLGSLLQEMKDLGGKARIAIEADFTNGSNAGNKRVQIVESNPHEQ